jgi:U3 small nucleolar RNA-associated protein 15
MLRRLTSLWCPMQVFDSGSRALLRQLKGHKAPVHVARFAADQLHVLSGGDDGVVAVWDVTSGQQVSSMLGHSDYVRSAVCSPASEEVWATSGYDHICKLWDARQRRCLLSVNHGAPIESAAFFPSGSLLVTAGGSDLCIWHVLQSGQLVQRVTAHQKTVTSVAIAALAGPQPHVVSAGLDGHVKVRMGHRRGLVACCVLLQSHHRIALRCAGFRLGNFSAIHCAQIPGAGAVPGRLACC